MNKKRGNILLQINIGFLLVCLVIVTFYQSFLEAFFNMRKIEEDLEVNRVHRLLISNIEQKITYQARQVCLVDNGYGTTLSCQQLGGKRLVEFYCRPNGQNDKVQGLYISTETLGAEAGVNPLTAPNLQVHKFQAEALDTTSFMLTLELGMVDSTRKHTFTEVFNLCNGIIV